MKVIATADLHYEFQDESRLETESLAKEVISRAPDAFIIAGDTFALDPSILSQCLALFEALRCPKLLVAGNHDIWTLTGDSMQIYEELLPQIASERGFHYLDKGPIFIGEVGFVGNMGWYDYSFREERLGVPLRFYEAKLAPGAALYRGRQDLFEGREDVTEEMKRISTIWKDGDMVRWNTNDYAFTERLVRSLEEQIARIESQARAVVCATHHIPFANMVLKKENRDWAFGNAFMGSVRMGEVLLRHPKVTHVVCGHSHVRGEFVNGHIRCLNVGSTYRKKFLVEFEL